MKKSSVKNFWILCGAVALSTATLITQPVVAQEEREGVDLGKYRIDLAGRERMLSQRIAKSVCFIELGYEVQMHHDLLEADFHLFEESLLELRDGGGIHNLPPETDRRILAELEIVFAHWAPFKAELENIIATNIVTYEAEEHIIQENLVMLQDMNDTTTLIEQEYANPNTLDMADAVTTNLMARQRMLSQKAAKDFCYIATGHHPEEERTNLNETKTLFTVSLGALINGYDLLGIAPPPTEEIASQLNIVSEIWTPLDNVFSHIVDGAEPTTQDIELVVAENTHLLAEMNKAVQLYLEH